MNVEQIARIAHETNRAYCESMGDNSQPKWEDAPEWQRESAVKGVQFRIDNPNCPESAQHDAWCADKLASGWKFGTVKDAEKKEHPCLVAYQDLPIEQRLKDYLFVGVVKALSA